MPNVPRVIDLRSDGVTRPSARMRDAMRDAIVGDDVYGDDPTANELEARAAEIFGREAALFLPSGTMANQVALFVHVQRGEEIVCDARADVFLWEMALPAILSGCLMRPVSTADGRLSWPAIAPVIQRDPAEWKATTGLIVIENPTNMAGGIVLSLAAMEEICREAHGRGIPVHLDGARIFNASAALRVSVERLSRSFDSVMFCLSKGLGAPVGSMLVGSVDFIARARRARKLLGGGMRQCGVLAAAGLIALDEGPARLPRDHEHAREIAGRLAAVRGLRVDLRRVETNVVHVAVPPPLRAGDLVSAVAQQGLLITAVDDRTVRLVTHQDVDCDHCLEAAAILARAVTAQGVVHESAVVRAHS